MFEREHRWVVHVAAFGTTKKRSGTAYDAPPDHTESPVLLRDSEGVIHSVVKVMDPEEKWLYCDIEVMKDWLVQDGKNVVPRDTAITCVKCLAGGHEG